MVRKSLKVFNGVSGKTVFYERKSNPRKHHENKDAQEKIDICLNCTKPAKECKGSCFGR